MKISKKLFGKTTEGKEMHLFTLANDKGMSVSITNLGGIITKLMVPGEKNSETDVVLGFDRAESYLDDNPYFGCIVGRYANRIANGKFTLNGRTYQLALNNGPNHLHGGPGGFHKKLWTASTDKKSDEVSLKLAYLSPDMEEGYPGNMMVEVIYTLNNKNELWMHFRAKTDASCYINLTNHSYFNLSGMKEKITDHWLGLNCEAYTPVNETLIPTGEIKKVEGTPFDFRLPKPIGRDFHLLENGYDHNFVVGKGKGELIWFAKAESLKTGICMEVGTTQPGVQFYTGNFLSNVKGKKGLVYQKHDGFCLETQHFPDTPNQTGFPSALLHPGEQYDHKAVYRFSHKPAR